METWHVQNHIGVRDKACVVSLLFWDILPVSQGAHWCIETCWNLCEIEFLADPWHFWGLDLSKSPLRIVQDSQSLECTFFLKESSNIRSTKGRPLLVTWCLYVIDFRHPDWPSLEIISSFHQPFRHLLPFWEQRHPTSFWRTHWFRFPLHGL